MTLKVNSSYPTATGFIIPRSHLKINNGEKYAIVQELTGGGSHFASRHVVMTTKDIRAKLALSQKERIIIE